MTETVALPALMTLTGVDIVAAGEWDLSSGETTFTTEDLAAAVASAQCPAIGKPVLKIAHADTDKHWPAVGRVANMTLTAEGNKITGDLAGMPGWLAAVLPSAYPARSIEANWNVQCQIGHVHPFVISALALLGELPPGVGVLNDLEDVAAVYGLSDVNAAAGRQGMSGKAFAAGVTTEDVRRAYYDASGTPYSFWITEMQLDPPQLIVSDDATAKVYRVPITIKGSEITFGDAQEVEIEYVDIAASRVKHEGARAKVIVRYADAEASRGGDVIATWSAATQVKNLGDSPTAAALKKMFALPGDTKSGSKLPHHMCSTDGVVGDANTDGCTAGIGAINGARGGLKGVSDDDLKRAYSHLAKHITDAGGTPPEFNAAAARAAADSDADDDPKELIAGLDATLDEAVGLVKDVDRSTLPEPVAQALDLLVAAEGTVDDVMTLLGIYDPDDEGASAAGVHAAFNGTHSHPHSAYGSQGGDQEHDHSHSHAGDNRHDHAHAAKGGNKKEGGSDVDFTTEQQAQLRAALGLEDGAELTPELVAGLASRPVKGAAARLPEGVVVIEQEAWDASNRRIQAMEAKEKRREVAERDEVIATAIRDGKFSVARKEHWVRLWNSDPDGTRIVLAGLAKNVVPVDDIGTSGGPGADDDLLDEEYRRLFPPGSYTPESAAQ